MADITQKNHRAFRIGIILNSIFIIVEAAYGFWGDSLALVADAGHNLSDVLGLALSWLALSLGSKKATDKRTYGYKSFSNLAAFGNAIFILIAIGGIVVEAINRLIKPEPVHSWPVIIVAAIGIVINGITAILFMEGQQKDLNIKSAFIHMASDALVSVGVVVAGIIMLFTHWYWIDPLISIVISIVVLIGTWHLLVTSFNLSMNAVPEDIDLKAIRNYLRHVPTVTGVHDLHVWGMSTTENALTVHLTRNTLEDNNHFIERLNHELTQRFDVCHITIQIELGKLDDESTDHSI